MEYKVDLSIYDKPLCKKYFYDLQSLAFDKGVRWITTGRRFESSDILAMQMDAGYRIIVDTQRKELLYGTQGREISFRQMVKLVKELPDEL